MSKDSKEGLETPKALHELTAENIHQVQKAFNEYISIARKNVAVMEWRASTAQSGTRDVWNKVIVFAEQNVTTSFDLAQRLTHATNLRELVDLQTEFAQSQMRALAEQMTELGEALALIISNSAGSKKEVAA